MLGWNAEAVAANFGDFWTPRGNVDIATGLSAATAFGLFVGLCVAQTGSLFSSDAWNNITFTAGEVKDPRRNLPLALALGTGLVTALYLLANVAYLVTLPLAAIQQAPADRVATATLDTIVPGLGATLMAAAILISTFGCNNGLILAGARAYYAMARDGLFFKRVGELNPAKVPAAGLVLQGVWSVLLVLPRTFDPATGRYGNLYGNLLDYVISAALIFYILTIAGIFRLRATRPDAERPYRAVGYPLVPALYIVGASTILLVLFAYRLVDDVARPGDRVARRAGVLRVERRIDDCRLQIDRITQIGMTNRARSVRKPARVPAIPSHQACGTARHPSDQTSSTIRAIVSVRGRRKSTASR